MAVDVEPEHRSILAVDIEAFSDPARTNPIRLRLHQHLTRLLPELLAQAGIPTGQYATADTGDGLIISIAPQTSTVRLLDPLVPRLARRLATFNRKKPSPRQIRLRLALHAGGVLSDPQPLHGETVIHTCRLLDGPAARACLAATHQPLAVIVSQVVYDEVIKHGFGRLDPTLWHPVIAKFKELRAPAWVHVPGDPDTPVRAQLITPAGRLVKGAESRSSPRQQPVKQLPARQLPGRLAEFTGRGQQLARLQELLSTVAAGSPAVAITAIDGLGGIGKSTLAVEAAWHLAEQFPDGQLYLDLHGSTLGLDPLTPLEALTHLLRSLGVDPRAIPTQVDEAAAHYRTLTSNRRLLLVLDNARDAAQVRPLLPGHPGSAVVVTSRDTLAFLEGVTRQPLNVLSEAEALELLGRLTGPDRLEAEPDAAARLVGLCDGLPLALQITGRRLATRSTWSLADYAARLADEQQRLDALSFGDRAVRSSLQLSYQLLDHHVARALRLLSLPDGPDISLPAAAALLDQPPGQVRAILESLVDTSLLGSPRADRYRFHDLVRVFAREHATSQHPLAEQAAALTRAFGFYTATAWHTLGLLRPGDRHPRTADAHWTQGGLHFADAPAALVWLEAERVNLLAAIRQTATASAVVPARLAGQLARALLGFFDVRSHWQDWIQANQVALELGHRTGDQVLQSYAANHLGIVYRRVGRYAEAIDQLQAALTVRRELGDRCGEAGSLGNLGLVYRRLGRYTEAVDHHEASLTGFREVGDRSGEAYSLNDLGRVYERLGRYAEGIDHLQASLTIHRELGDRRGEAISLGNLGRVYERVGRHVGAINCQEANRTIRRELGDRRGEAISLNDLGRVYERLGRYAEGIDHLQASLTIHRELGDRRGEAEALRDLGDVFRAVGREAEAQAAWREALVLCETLQLPEADEIGARLGQGAPETPHPIPGRSPNTEK